MVDGYSGYQRACTEYGITRLGCWAHARRKFKDAQALQKKGKIGKADQALAYIQKLYAIEKKIKDEPPNRRYERRQKEATPVLKKPNSWMEKSLLTVAPKTAIGKALLYLNNQWDRLAAYLNDGCYPIDYNAAERAIRPFNGLAEVYWVAMEVDGNGARPLDHARDRTSDTKDGIGMDPGQRTLQLPTSIIKP